MTQTDGEQVKASLRNTAKMHAIALIMIAVLWTTVPYVPVEIDNFHPQIMVKILLAGLTSMLSVTFVVGLYVIHRIEKSEEDLAKAVELSRKIDKIQETEDD